MTLRKVALVALLSAITVPGFAANPAKKTPFFRPKNVNPKERSQAITPRATSGPVVVNAASYLPGISPGGLATIFGENLTSVSGVIIAGTDPLPVHLGGVTVLVDGVASPIFSIAFANGLDQISFQVPYDTATGLGAVEITVINSGQQTADFITDSYTEDPGIFTYNGDYAIALSGTDYSLIGPDNPTFPGEWLVLYTTGLGPLSLDLLDGFGAPTSEPFARTIDPLQVFVDKEQCDVYFSGLAPGFVGLYQINFRVPLDAFRGNLDLQIQTPYAVGNIATLPVN